MTQERRKTPSANGAIEVRKARASDLESLAALYEQLNLSVYREVQVSKSEMRRAYERIRHDRNHAILIAVSGGRALGTAHVIIVPHLGHGLSPAAIVENVVVDSAERSQGVGARLMEAATTIASRNGCYKLALTTNLKRRRAHRFYQRLGWRRTHYGYSLRLEAK